MSLLQYVKVGIVGGSDHHKICEQLGTGGKGPILHDMILDDQLPVLERLLP
jgi:hypothetical protein